MNSADETVDSGRWGGSKWVVSRLGAATHCRAAVKMLSTCPSLRHASSHLATKWRTRRALSQG